ncbi:MrcB family domain-containing protein [Chloroflexota bacterium]
MISNTTGTQPAELRLQKGLEQILELQPKWKSSNSPEMQERGQLIRGSLPKVLRTILPTISELESSGFRVEGRDGTGLKTRVPWVRLFFPTHSPSATEGWYAVYIFASDGSAVFLSLNQGTTTYSNGTFVPRPRDYIHCKRAMR